MLLGDFRAVNIWASVADLRPFKFNSYLGTAGCPGVHQPLSKEYMEYNLCK